MADSKHRKHRGPQLRVVFDTNALYTESENYLVQHSVANLIRESTFPDLEIQWYLPESVRHERQYQMQKAALTLMPHIERVERLLGHNLAITHEILLSSVEKVVSQRQEELNLLPRRLDCRRANLATTMRYYVKDVPENTQAGMNLLENLCNQSATDSNARPN